MDHSNLSSKVQLSENSSLKKILGVTFGIAVTIGGTIGVGILRTPGMVASQLGSAWLIFIAWVIGGIYALLGSVSVIELGTMYPKAGGWYVFVRKAFGDYPGFIIGWSDWIATSASLASIALAVGEFFSVLFPELSYDIKSIAIIIVLIFAFIQWVGLKSSSKTQEVTSFLKALGFLALVAACFIFGGHLNTTSNIPIKIPTTSSALFIGLVIALQSIIFTYDGWYSAVYFIEEDKNPGKNLPRSAIGGVLATIVIYLLVNLGLLYVLPVSKLAGSIAPATDAAQTIFGNEGAKIITVLSIISLIGILNAVLLIATRIIYGLSRDELFTTKISSVSDTGTPRAALLLSTIFSILLISSGTVEILIALSAFFYVANYFAGFSALFVLRKKEPDTPRPFKAWGYPWTTLLFLIGSFVFLIGDVIGDPLNAFFALIYAALSYPAFLFIKKLNLKKKNIKT